MVNTTLLLYQSVLAVASSLVIMSRSSDVDTQLSAPSINVDSLSYSFPDGSDGLKSVNLVLPPGSRTLLIGGCCPLNQVPSNGH